VEAWSADGDVVEFPWNHHLLGFGSKGNSWEMATVKHTRPWVRRSTRLLVGGGLALSAFGLAGGSDPWAQADPAPPPGYHWCPGDQWDPGWGSVYDWDWNHCQRLARSGRPKWSRGLGTLGPPAVGAAATTSTAVGAWGPADVEPDCPCLGILGTAPYDPGLPGSTTRAKQKPLGGSDAGRWNNGIWTPV